MQIVKLALKSVNFILGFSEASHCEYTYNFILLL